MSCKKSTKYISKKVLSSKVPVDKGVQTSTNRDSFIGLHDWHELGVLPPGGTTNQVLAKCSNANYNVQWVDAINTVIPPPITDIIVENTLFVMGNGDDGTGTRERFDLPYASINAAVLAAQLLDTVIVYPGTYTVALGDTLLTEYVKLYLHPNARLIINEPNGVIVDCNNSGIYGDGEIFIGNSEEPSKLTFTLNSPYFHFECNLLYSIDSAVTIDSTGVFNSTIDFKVNNIQYGNDATNIFLDLDGSSGTQSNNTINIDINTASVTNGGNNFMRIQGQNASTVNVSINKLFYTCSVQDIIILDDNKKSSLINIDIKNCKQTNILESNTTNAIIYNDLCNATKQIDIKNIRGSILLYRNGSLLNSNVESGKYKFSGYLILDRKVDSLIDVRKPFQNVTFVIDLEIFFNSLSISYDGVHRVFGISKETPSISAARYNQTITGKVHVISDDVVSKTDGVFEYGENINVDSTCILDNLKIICWGQPCISMNDPLCTASVPIIDVYTNSDDDTTPSYLIDADINFDLNVR